MNQKLVAEWSSNSSFGVQEVELDYFAVTVTIPEMEKTMTVKEIDAAHIPQICTKH